MKAIKKFTCALATTAVLAFCSSSAHAVIHTTTNDIILTFSLTVSTNSEKDINPTNIITTVKPLKLVNKNLLAMLGSKDFADETFSNGDQIAVAYDQPWNGDVLIVDKTGSNVLYDATFNRGNTNATLAVDLRHNFGTFSDNINFKPSGSTTYTFFLGGNFTLLDTTNQTSLAGSGPSTLKINQTLNSSKEFSTNPFSAWSDSVNFNFFGADQVEFNDVGGTVSGTVTGKGSGKGRNGAFLID